MLHNAGTTVALGARVCGSTSAGHVWGLKISGKLRPSTNAAAVSRPRPSYTLRDGRLGASPVARWSPWGYPELSAMWLEAQGRAHAVGRVTQHSVAGQVRPEWAGSVMLWPWAPPQDFGHGSDPFRRGSVGLGMSVGSAEPGRQEVQLRATTLFAMPTEEGEERWLAVGATREGEVSASYSVVTLRPSYISLPLLPHAKVGAATYEVCASVPTQWSLDRIDINRFKFGLQYSVNV